MGVVPLLLLLKPKLVSPFQRRQIMGYSNMVLDQETFYNISLSMIATSAIANILFYYYHLIPWPFSRKNWQYWKP